MAENLAGAGSALIWASRRMIMRKRLIDQRQRSRFCIVAIGDYQVEAAKTHAAGAISALAIWRRLLLSLYGAACRWQWTTIRHAISAASCGGGAHAGICRFAEQTDRRGDLKKALAQRDRSARRLGQGGGAGHGTVVCRRLARRLPRSTIRGWKCW